MIRTWKAKGRGKYKNQTINSSEYFIKNNCVSCGWGLPELENKNLILDFDSYKEKWIELYGSEKNWGNQGVHHLFESLRKGDFIWTRLEGDYYVAEVPDNPKDLFNYDFSEQAMLHDCSIQLTNILWKKVGAEDAVPGSISTYSSNRNSLVRVDNFESEQSGYTITSLFSKRIIDSNFDKKINDRKMIMRFIGPSGLEDVVALWLYDKFNYVVIPSTNKKSTQTYEFVLVDAAQSNGQYLSSKRIYIQVKNGRKNLRVNDYVSLLNNEDEIWLVTAYGNIYDQENQLESHKILQYIKQSNKNYKNGYDIEQLIDFIFDENKKNILPRSVLTWVSLFE